MSDYANKLSALLEKKQSLIAEETKLIEKRKKEIGRIAEHFDLLTASDALIAGIFQEAHDAIQNKSEKIKIWESQGAAFAKPKRANSKEAEVLAG